MAGPPISVLFALLSAFSLISSAADSTATIQEVLRDYGLPVGLFPKTVESFAFDPATGLLEVRLDHPCYVNYDGLAYFDQVVRGNLSHGELRRMEGLSQKELFLWLPVKGVLVADPSAGVILFDIGLAHKQLSLSLFETPPECRPVNNEGLLGRKVGIQEQAVSSSSSF